jgi:hypothetical protein
VNDIARRQTHPMIPQPKGAMSALAAKEYAQWLALAPFAFQAARVLRTTGILAALGKAPAGLLQKELAQELALPPYGVRVLLEAGLGIGLVTEDDGGRYHATKTASYLLHDDMTRANMDFAHDVCYQGLFHLEEAVRSGKPAGLKVHGGNWQTIYEALAHLPEPARSSWFAFDHYYSDVAFPAVLPLVFGAHAPRRLLDIGGNTGKWALACLRHDPRVEVTLMDLPGQLAAARATLAEAGVAARVHYHEADLLDERTPIPGGFDAIWMSQFLDCFSEAQIVSILKRCVAASTPATRIYVLEPFWDRQRFASAAFCQQMTSLYFTVLANGTSQMYRSSVFLECVRAAGLVPEAQHDGLGASSTLLVCRVAGRG